MYEMMSCTIHFILLCTMHVFTYSVHPQSLYQIQWDVGLWENDYSPGRHKGKYNLKGEVKTFKKNETTCSDGIQKKQPNKVGAIPQYFYGFNLPSLHLYTHAWLSAAIFKGPNVLGLPYIV